MSGDNWLESMVERVEWMSPVHYEVLYFFDEHDIVISPRDLALNIDYTRKYIGQECRKLADAGLLENDDGKFSLSDLGREFLAGDLDADEVEDLDPDA